MTTIVTAPSFGGPEVLTLEETDLQAPGPQQVAIKVRAIGVNPADCKHRAGRFGGSVPVRLGSEAAGVVTAVGEGVTDVFVGDEVIAYRAPGAYATDLVVPRKAVVPKPVSLAWVDAAALLLAGVTAVHALEATHVGADDTVLIHGAAGGVGQMAVQLARLRGARVIGTAGPSGAAIVSDVGGEPTPYGDGLAERVTALAPEGVTVALDLIGTDEALAASLAVVDDRERIASIVPRPAAMDAGIQVLGGGAGADPGTQIREAARVELARLAAEGAIRVRVVRTFRLADVAEAHRFLERGHADGKVVLLP
ncbi:quinone oxidoreductase family protein [Demequina capsici]|uniref:NADP-dependent oxidoreductase n=1 Tax=Demequina capsici TaxID=3075620 RepID=A0AA96F800_9MICO|nr:NADP-dependent oxidoreductase [Demequina sp. OYTSA14]WNM24512.1 NADP-dependent oxidoreductase [Demequina sp. OYTSA14]